jgi:periplasmic protein CpxP/Spy
LEDIALRKFTMLATMLLATGSAFAQAPAPTSNTPTSNTPASNTPASSTPAANTPTSGTPAHATRVATSPAAVPAKGLESGPRVDQRITEMHQRLKITPAQEANWAAFAKVMRDNAAATEDAYKERRANIATMSAPDNMRDFAQIEQARAQGVQNLAASFQTLYDGMSDDQKKLADAMFRNYEAHRTTHKKATK